MFKDLIIGQYIDTGSLVHKLNPSFKIVMTVLFMAVAFLIKGVVPFSVFFLLVAALIRISGVPVRLVLKGIKPVIFLAVFTLVVNSFLTSGDVLFGFWRLHVTYQGLELGIIYAVRLILLVCGASVLTLTTSPLSLTYGLEQLMKPLAFFKVPVHDIAMMMTISIRFIPTLGEEASRIMDAQASRGAGFDDRNIVGKVRALMPILIPLFVSAFRHSDELAVAMDARCYNSSKRTHLNEPKITSLDIKASVVFLVICVTITAMQYFIG